MAAASMSYAARTCVVSSPSHSSISTSSSSSCCSTSSCSLASRPARLVSLSSSKPSSSSSPLSAPLIRPANLSSVSCQASPDKKPSTPVTMKSILCTNCEGNGAVVCSQCLGEGLNTEDHFGGRFKAGTICWLCRGKKQMLCGNCNGAGFMGGFLNTQDD